MREVASRSADARGAGIVAPTRSFGGAAPIDESAAAKRRFGIVAPVDETAVAVDDAGSLCASTGERMLVGGPGVFRGEARPGGAARLGAMARPDAVRADNKKAATRAAETWGMKSILSFQSPR